MLLTSFAISEGLKKLRTERNMTAKYVVSLLAEKGPKISEKTLYGYESGLSMPNADVFILLCQIYGINNPMSLFEEKSAPSEDEALLNVFHSLNEQGREKLLEYADDLADTGKYIKTGQSPMGKEA